MRTFALFVRGTIGAALGCGLAQIITRSIDFGHVFENVTAMMFLFGITFGIISAALHYIIVPVPSIGSCLFVSTAVIILVTVAFSDMQPDELRDSMQFLLTLGLVGAGGFLFSLPFCRIRALLNLSLIQHSDQNK